MTIHQVFVTIDNSKNDSLLTIDSSSVIHGHWNPAPPITIEGGSVAKFTCTASAGFYGAEATVTYDTADGGQIAMAFGDPIVESNYASVDTSGTRLKTPWKGKSDNSDWEPKAVPSSGNPVYVEVDVIGG